MTIKFEQGKTYYGRFVSDSDSHYHYRVERRTDKSVWLDRVNPTTGEVLESVGRKAVKPAYSGDHEMCYPMGTGYSMAPILGADKPFALGSAA